MNKIKLILFFSFCILFWSGLFFGLCSAVAKPVAKQPVQPEIKTMFCGGIPASHYRTIILTYAKYGYELKAVIPEYDINTQGGTNWQNGMATPAKCTLIFQK